MENLKHIVESLLFISAEPVSMESLKKSIPEADPVLIDQALDELFHEYDVRGGGFCLRQVAGGYQLRTRPEYAPWIRRLHEAQPVRLSRAALETLAIIAYNQPVLRSYMEHIRGVDCGGVLKQLLDKQLVRVLGRDDKPGRPMLYATTKKFLEVFDLKDLAELPTLKEIQELGMREKEEGGGEIQEQTPAPTYLEPGDMPPVDPDEDWVDDDPQDDSGEGQGGLHQDEEGEGFAESSPSVLLEEHPQKSPPDLEAPPEAMPGEEEALEWARAADKTVAGKPGHGPDREIAGNSGAEAADGYSPVQDFARPSAEAGQDPDFEEEQEPRETISQAKPRGSGYDLIADLELSHDPDEETGREPEGGGAEEEVGLETRDEPAKEEDFGRRSSQVDQDGVPDGPQEKVESALEPKPRKPGYDLIADLELSQEWEEDDE